MRKNLAVLTNVQLAQYFISMNEKSLTCAVSDYLTVSREANRARAYGVQTYGLFDWQSLIYQASNPPSKTT